MKLHHLHHSLRLPRALSEIFPFFAAPGNLEELTPPWLRFEVIGCEPAAMGAGTKIDYRLRLRGVPFRWQSEITAWAPPYRFVDEQRRGPYRVWIHEHRFSEHEGATIVEDLVDYAVPGGALVHKLLVERDVKRIFEYRRRRMEELFGAIAEAA